MQHYSEKRDFIRMRIKTPITFAFDGVNYAALCIDLSSTGLQIETEAHIEFSQGQRLHVSIPSTHAKLRGLEAETQVQRIEHLDNGYVALGLKIISMQ